MKNEKRNLQQAGYWYALTSGEKLPDKQDT